MRCVALLLALTLVAADDAVRSHPSPRPLPTVSQRPLPMGRVVYADAVRGDDSHDGSPARPWKTLAHAAGQLRPGDTLCLHGGVYHEHATLSIAGTDEQPITIRSAPGELAILDGGRAEFLEHPAQAWEPVPGGAAGECRSRRTYPTEGVRDGGVNVMGRFTDSYLPLHGYRSVMAGLVAITAARPGSQWRSTRTRSWPSARRATTMAPTAWGMASLTAALGRCLTTSSV